MLVSDMYMLIDLKYARAYALFTKAFCYAQKGQICLKICGPYGPKPIVLAIQILLTCPLKNYVILVLKQSTGTSLSMSSQNNQCPLELMSSTSSCSLLKLKQIHQVKQTLTAIIFKQRKQLVPPTHISHFHAPSNPFRHKSDSGKGRCSHS